MRREYHGPDDHRFCAEEQREDEPKRHRPVKAPSAQKHALEGHEVLASASMENWRYPERETTYNKDDGEDPMICCIR